MSNGRFHYNGKFIAELNPNTLEGEKQILEHMNKPPMSERLCYHDAIVCSRRKWFFGLFGPKVWVVRCWNCDYCSKEFKSLCDATEHRYNLEKRG